MIPALGRMMRSGTAIVLAVSLIPALYLWVAGCIQWLGDGQTYTNYAYFLARGQFDPGVAWRTPGYPIFLILTGLTAFKSLHGVVLGQALSAALIPTAAYWALRPLGRVGAWTAVAVSILSLIPYMCVTVIYPDQLYISALACFTALLVRYGISETRPWVARLIPVMAMGLFLLRPVGLVLLLLAVGVIAFRRRHVRAAGVALLLSVAAVEGFSLYKHHQMGSKSPSMFGRQVFFNVYMTYPEFKTSPAFERQFAVDLEKLRGRVGDIRVWVTHPSAEKLRYLYPEPNNMATVASMMLRHPNIAYFQIFYCMIDFTDPHLDGQLLRWCVINIFQDPRPYLAGIVDRYEALSFGQTSAYNLEAVTPDLKPHTMITGRGPYSFIPGTLDDAHSIIPMHLDRYGPPLWAVPWNAVLASYYVRIYPWVLVASYAVMVLGLVCALFFGGAFRCAALIVFGVHAINVGALAVLVQADYRYQLESIPVAILGTGLGVQLICLLAQSRLRENEMGAPPAAGKP